MNTWFLKVDLLPEWVCSQAHEKFDLYLNILAKISADEWSFVFMNGVWVIPVNVSFGIQ